MEAVGRYEVMETLGQGAMGRVYLGLDPKLRREVAIKVLHDHVAADETRRRMFHREARATAALDHPNIMKVFDYSGPEENTQYIVFQRLRGVDLGTVLDALLQLPEVLVLAMAYEVSLALEHAHENGLVHRDLKPDNLFLEPDGRVVLGDFGIAKAYEEEESLGHTMMVEKSKLMGTPLYMAPEQLTKRRYGPASDVFSLGSVMFHLVCGVPPFAGRGHELLSRIADGRVRFVRTIDPTISVECAALIHSMMSPDENARPTGEALRTQLRILLDNEGVRDTRALLERCFFAPEELAEELRARQIERHEAQPDATDPDSTDIGMMPLVPVAEEPVGLSARVMMLVVSAVLGIGTGLIALIVLRGL